MCQTYNYWQSKQSGLNDLHSENCFENIYNNQHSRDFGLKSLPKNLGTSVETSDLGCLHVRTGEIFWIQLIKIQHKLTSFRWNLPFIHSVGAPSGNILCNKGSLEELSSLLQSLGKPVRAILLNCAALYEIWGYDGQTVLRRDPFYFSSIIIKRVCANTFKNHCKTSYQRTL